MTTIAFRDGVIAADGYSTNGETVVERSAQKLFRLNDGRWCAGCGSRAIIARYREWLNHGGERPALSSPDEKRDAALLVVGINGCELHEQDGVVQINAEFTAIGNGEMAALAAMHMGADAVKAIEIAALCDVFTGGEIHSADVTVIAESKDLPIENIDPPAPDWRYKYGLSGSSVGNRHARLNRHIER